MLKLIIVSQNVKPYYENNKWGYKSDKTIIIKAQYDTVFEFNTQHNLALVGNKNEFNKTVNPLTGLSEKTIDYHYINNKNNKLKLLVTNFPDSIYTFQNQQEFEKLYLDSNSVFKILFQQKVYLVSKKGKQLSTGYDNILLDKTKSFYETETYALVDKKPIFIKGLIDSTGKIIVPCKYKEVNINTEDTSIYCCSAVYNNKTNDDVYDKFGNLFYTNKHHISFSSKKIHVYKLYSPKPLFMIENETTKDSYDVEGNHFYYLQNNKALITSEQYWYFVDLNLGKKQKVNKSKLITNLNLIFGL